jgi:trimethylamine:corrinoid methyltransferase-like protein
MALRLARGIEPREDFPAVPHFLELLAEGHVLITEHTRRHLRREITFPGPVIDRANRSRWQEEGSLPLGERARREVERLLASYQPSRLPGETARELARLMEAEARRAGMPALPARDA